MLSRRALPQLRSALNNAARLASSSTTPATKPKESGVVTREDQPATLQQSPNYATTWSTNQAPRPGPGAGPRFEQTNMNLQPNPLSAMEMVAREPIRLVKGRTAVCDGGARSCYHLFVDLLTIHEPCLLYRRRTPGSPQDLHQLSTSKIIQVSAAS